jgi:hypothetical protein
MKRSWIEEEGRHINYHKNINRLQKMLDLQHQYKNCTTIPHMRVGPTYWGPPLCEGLLCSYCIDVVQESNLINYLQINVVNSINSRDIYHVSY